MCLNIKAILYLIPSGTSKRDDIIYFNLRYRKNKSNAFIRKKVCVSMTHSLSEILSDMTIVWGENLGFRPAPRYSSIIANIFHSAFQGKAAASSPASEVQAWTTWYTASWQHGLPVDLVTQRYPSTTHLWKVQQSPSSLAQGSCAQPLCSKGDSFNKLSPMDWSAVFSHCSGSPSSLLLGNKVYELIYKDLMKECHSLYATWFSFGCFFFFFRVNLVHRMLSLWSW